MNSIALPQRQLLLPRFELPAWVKRLGDPLHMGQIAAGGVNGGANVGAVGIAQTKAVTPPSNWWEAGGATGAVAAYQAKGAASYAASKVNLANPGTHDLTESANPVTWDTSLGWELTSSNDNALETGIVVPSTDWTFAVQFANKTAGRFIVGAFDGNSQVILLGTSADNADAHVANCEFNPISGAGISSGNLCVAGQKLYVNGVFVADLTVGAAPTHSLWIGRLNGFGQPNADVQTRAEVNYNNTLNATEVAALAAAMAAL